MSAEGTLQIFRTESQLKASAKDIAVLEENNVPYELLDAEGCVAAEPGLTDVKRRHRWWLTSVKRYDG